ncbi:helix-turn-helix domain-containing protein [Amycolatopsis sp. CA-126428]|uniref:helix-turn-helix domain-containing protein n=1 Tax=Amycolatopsis sp. CA-126428 TaxID=2073158 RepID=UPI000CD0EEE8|nr:helix-turn-helix transcriptional regulator [Amycolatopsis sp. CA-126428]
MKWNLRLAAANRGIWQASELQRMLAEHGLVISAGKMSGLWSGNPASIKLTDLDVFCTVIDCGVEELLLPEPVEAAGADASAAPAVVATGTNSPTPRPQSGRSMPPR